MTRARRTRTPHRLLAALTGIALLAAVALAPTAQTTEASWADAEVGAAEFTAATMPAPTVTSCAVQTVLGLQFRSVTITWTSAYGPEHNTLTVRPPGGTPVPVDANNVAVSGPSNGVYSYTSVLTMGILQNLLGNLLGGQSVLSVVERYPDSSWTSPETTRTLSVSALGGLLGNTCTAP